ncbi:Uncharacterized protein Fot_04362 [Forsythia ovata]|uniref:Uncharacterized protein n=1 Tax=Forsythia ovata TaxID=205694 RepID=A0ABD1XFD3_9LAMI
MLLTEAKLEEVYWQELTPCVEEEDTASKDSKGYGTEYDVEPSHFFHQHSPRVSQPPPICHDHNIANVVRMEMEKLERRLLGVISKQLDHTESKIDSLVELAVVANVPETQLEMGRKKEAGLDDVMDEPEKERMLEDEAGEELDGRKQCGEDENVTNETEYVKKGMSAEFLHRRNLRRMRTNLLNHRASTTFEKISMISP